ncbi:MAG: diguanylate cyclase [Rhodobacteraceae bacterium]|nr:diguanylate cyclase [Paracoccaceae bacterium]
MSRRILVVDDLSINRAILRATLRAACYDCLTADHGQKALDLARECRPDLILLDYCLPDMTGLELCRILRADPASCDTPIVLFSARADRAQRLQALGAGADDFLQKPLDTGFLLGRIRSLLRINRTHSPPFALCALSGPSGMAEQPATAAPVARVDMICEPESDADGLIAAAPRLFDAMICRTLSLSDSLLQPEGTPAPDLLVVSPAVLARNGVQALADLQSRSVTRQSEICVVLSHAQQSLGAMALDLGAREVLRLPLDIEDARLRLLAILKRKAWRDAQARAMEDQLDMALRDPLTGLNNRRYLSGEILRVAQDLQRGALTGCALLLVDLDHFKAVNDRYGHNTGDDVLIEVAQRMRASLRASDIIARYGGEEFVILLPQTPLGEARSIAQRLCNTLDQAPYRVGGRDIGQRITASVGIAMQSGPVDTAPDGFGRMMIDQADKALQSAKTGGRNRVVIAQAALA